MAEKTVDGYIESLSGWQAQAVSQVRDIVNTAVPEAEEAVKWAQPVWNFLGPFAYIKAFKQHVNYGFWRGAELSDPQDLLQGGGEKMRHVKIASLADINEEAFAAFAKEALELNRTKGDPTAPGAE